MKIILEKLRSYALSIIVPVVVIIILLIISPETRSISAVISLLRQGFAYAVLGWGVLFNMQVGNWDFSIGARVVLGSILAGGIAMTYNLGLVVFCILAIVFSLGLGLIVGYAYKLLKIPTLILSIGLCLIFESITRIMYGGNGVKLSSNFMLLGRLPYDLIAFCVCFAIAAYIYYKRKIGYNVRAVGTNPVVSETNGINAMNTKTYALIISGLFAGLYVIISMSKSGVCAAVSGTLGSTSTVFDAMMCVLIGMAICGKGNIIFSLYSGALVTQAVKMGMVALGIPSTFNKVVIAAVVVIFMIGSSRSDIFMKIRDRLSPRRRKAETVDAG